jgi:hypothetical protein
MDKSKSLKKLIPHALAIIIFYLLSMVIYWPLFFENKTMNQNDILQGAGANQEIIDFREKTGEEALWTNGMFSGMPAYLINVGWSGELVKYIPVFIASIIPSPASHTFTAMLAFYILLLVFRVNPYLAIAGGLAYGLNTFFQISVEAGHIWKVAAISWMPLVLSGIILTFRKRYVAGFIITALAMALEIRSNHYQITYYLLLIVLTYGIFKLIQAIRNKTLPDFAKIIGILTLAVLLGVGANFGKIWTAYEYSKYSIRGAAVLSSNTESGGGLDRDYAFAWSNGIWEPMTFLMPNFYGGASQEEVSMNSALAEGLKKQGAGSGQIKNFVKSVPTYWGDQPFTSGPYYLGAIVVFLFVLGCFVVKGHLKWWLVSATVLGIVLSWGKNFEIFNYLIFDYLPGYNKFRAVSMTVAIPFLCMPLLGFLGLKEISETDWSKNKKSFLTALGITAGFCLLLVAASFLMKFRGNVDTQLGDQAVLIDLIRDQRASMFRTDAFRSFFFIIAAGAILYFWKENRLKQHLATTLFLVVLMVDYIPVTKRYLNDDNFKKDVKGSFFAKSAADQKIDEDTEHYRVLNLNNPFNEARTSYYHSSIGGYHGAKMRRYQDLIENHLQPEMTALIENLRSGNTDFSEFGVINMLNTKYIKFGDQAEQVLSNPSAFGNAWFVSNVESVDSPDAVNERLSNINTRSKALIDISEFPIAEKNFSTGEIKLVDYAPNQLKYSSTNTGAGLAVFSEIYYPLGWKAFIDGEESEVLRANYVLRALRVPAGKHEIVFKFEPKAFYLGNQIMWASSILLFFVLIGGMVLEFRKS